MRDPLDPCAIDLIKRFEGLGDGDRQQPGIQPYLDPIGVWTIGYGATYDMNRDRVTKNTPTMAIPEVELLLSRDLDRFAAAVDRMVKASICDLQRGALASFAFNLGAGALKSSTLLRRVNSYEWDDAPNQFRRWVYAGGRMLPGLVRRRQAEATLFARGSNGVKKAGEGAEKLPGPSRRVLQG